MTVLAWLASVFLPLAGYSAGAVLGSWGRPGTARVNPSPGLLDTAMVIVVWIGVVTSRLAGVDTWTAIGLWLAAALAAGFILNRVRPQPDEEKQLPQ